MRKNDYTVDRFLASIGPQWSLYICRRRDHLTQQGWSVWDMAKWRPISSNAIRKNGQRTAEWS